MSGTRAREVQVHVEHEASRVRGHVGHVGQVI